MTQERILAITNNVCLLGVFGIVILFIIFAEMLKRGPTPETAAGLRRSG